VHRKGSSARRRAGARLGRRPRRVGDMFDARSWRFANLFTLSERISTRAPLGSCGSSSCRSTGCVKLQVSEQRPVSMYPAARSI
jgi:hypothetical protein